MSTKFNPNNQILLLILLIFLAICTTTFSRRPQLLVVIFDGFRWDYPCKYHLDSFKFLAKTGVRAPKGFRPTFPSVTNPALWTLMTGLYTESHGVYDNSLYYNKLKSRQYSSTTVGHPIWAIAKEQGLRAGVSGWENVIDNWKSTYWHNYNSSVSLKSLFNLAIKWLKKDKVDLAIVYYDQPDFKEHGYGVGSPPVVKKIREIDRFLGYLLDKLTKINLLNHTNIIVLSDHGMINVTDVLYLNNYLDLDKDVQNLDPLGVVTGVWPKPGKLKTVYRKLKKIPYNMKVYLKENFPVHFHYANNLKVAPIILLPDEGHLIFDKRSSGSGPTATHGFDNRLSSMRPIFYARGPDFKIRKKTPMFDAVNVYSLMTHLLGVQPAPNNGTVKPFESVLTRR